jgi:membrane protein implicated in regulation of membrane protease activity
MDKDLKAVFACIELLIASGITIIVGIILLTSNNMGWEISGVLFLLASLVSTFLLEKKKKKVGLS